jgi:mono/diheme cytochrome c family protein
MCKALTGLALIVCLPILISAQANTSEQTRKLYVSKCAKCHGSNGVPRPIAKGARRFIDPTWAPPIEKVQEVILNGAGEEMPKFKGALSPQQILALAEFVLAFKNRGS